MFLATESCVSCIGSSVYPMLPAHGYIFEAVDAIIVTIYNSGVV